MLIQPGQANIIERIIYAGDTPLASTCTVTQTGPMELTISACSLTTTGQAKIIKREKVRNLPTDILAGRAEIMPDNKWVRVWLKNKNGNFINKSKTYTLLNPVVLTIPPGNTWVVYLTSKPGSRMGVVFQSWTSPRPTNFIEYIIIEFNVPIGTINLNTIDIEILTVKPNFKEP